MFFGTNMKNDKVIRKFSNCATEEELKEDLTLGKMEVKSGLNRFNWNLYYPSAKGFPGIILWGGSLRGPKAIPGSYKVKL